MTDHDYDTIRMAVARLLYPDWQVRQEGCPLPLMNTWWAIKGDDRFEIPHYPRDLNAAVAAVEARGHEWCMWRCGGSVAASVWKGDCREVSSAAAPARALCLALLKAEGASASTDRTEGEPPSSDQTRGSSTENGRSPRAGAAQEGRRS